MSAISSWVAWDTETALIGPGRNAPPLTCVQWCTTEDVTQEHPSQWPAYVTNWEPGLAWVRHWLQSPTTGLVGHNVAFDMAVAMAEDPSLVPLVFQAYEQDRVTDTMLRQQLLDIAAGRFKGEFGANGGWYRPKHGLGDVAKKLLGWMLDKPKEKKVKGPDDDEPEDGDDGEEQSWRLRYGQLRDVPVHEWPEDARKYALDDGRSTLGIFLRQEEHREWLDDQYRQARRALWLALAKNWGLRTHPAGVEAFALTVEAEIADVQAELEGYGLARKDGTRDTKAATRRMLEVCREKGLEVVPTKTAEKLIKAGGDWDPYTSLKGVALDADSCERTEDPQLGTYAKFGVLKAVQSKDLKMLRADGWYLVHTRYNIVETGRTSSSSPNVQNIRRLPGIRECFIPRDGWWYMQADYPGLELRTLAQVCIWLVGHSALAHALNQGLDPHLMLAANIAHCTYDEAKALYKADKNWRPRQAAKVANFGFPGGLGAESFVAYARGSYKVIITEQEAKELKHYWRQTWPEMEGYFAYVSAMCSNEKHEAMELRHPMSNRIRGKVRYTAACNSYFQGLGADATSEAGWLIAKAQYAEPSSPLYGSRTVNFIHDEFIAEVVADPDRASAAAHELCRLMMVGANRWLPDVPFTLESIEPVLMTHWSKDAQTLMDKTGKLHVWENKAQGKAWMEAHK